MSERTEQEATDQPPPTNGPLTRAQIVSMVVPVVSLLLLTGLIVWGLLSSGHNATATPGLPAATATPGAPAIPTPTSAPAATLPPASTPAAAAASPAAPSPAATLGPTEPPTQPAVATSTQEPAAPTPTTQNSAAVPTPTTQNSKLKTQNSTGKPLLGKRIALDPGHGPRNDLGAVLVSTDTGKLVLTEAELDLDVAFRCRTLLEARGAQVVMTRETADTFTAPWPPDTNGDGIKRDEADDLQERIDIFNNFHADVFLSIHANGNANPAKRQGIQALYCATPDCPFRDENKRLGTLALDQLEVQLAAAGDPVQRRELRDDFWSDTPGDPPGHLFMLGPANPPRHARAVQMPGVIVESLYVTSPVEAAQLKQDNVRDAIALAYANALQEFLTTPAP
ncbi:MAG: N-acetylmuramoyl-L-alanine amidase family protein [Chloroflexia bacterium]